jgi:hypothetical protein
MFLSECHTKQFLDCSMSIPYPKCGLFGLHLCTTKFVVEQCGARLETSEEGSADDM